MAKLLTEELALQLTEMLLKNDKNIQDDLQKQIEEISPDEILDNVIYEGGEIIP